jgi:hypothetical protein
MDPRTFLRNDAKTIGLSSREDADAYTMIMQYVRSHPAKSTVITSNDANDSFVEHCFRMFRSPMLILRPTTMFFSIFILFAFGVGISQTAKSALPGDFMYPLKVHVNEKARATFLFSPDSRAWFEVERLEQRLEEAATLAASGRLNDRLRSDIAKSLHEQLEMTQHAARLLSEIGDYQGALDVHSRIESDLVAHAIILGFIMEVPSLTSDDVEKLRVDVSKAETVIRKIRTESEMSISAAPEADRRIAAERNLQLATDRIGSAQAAMEQRRPRTEHRILVQAEARLTFSRRMLSAARSKMDAGDSDEASKLAGEAIRAALEVKTILKVSSAVQKRTR